MSEQTRQALAKRLGIDGAKMGPVHPMALVTFEEYFDHNDPVDLDRYFHDLHAIRSRDDVLDVRLGILNWHGPDTWPQPEYIYLVTSARVAEAKSWFLDIGIWFDEFKSSGEHVEREPLDVPKGYKIVWGWWD